ncbi:SRPBCC domain-containing protein [Leucobacter sp. VD1]|uniref:SRPBCC domain-containing protein n=1 Tax=Leucobacter sp. VD1 TaxID=3080381 RepID=UPI003019E2AD
MIDVNSQVTAVSRELRDEEIDGTPARVQSLSQEYPAAIDDVWEAVTNADRIARWFLPVSGELRLGGRYRLGTQAASLSPAEAQAWAFTDEGRAFYRAAADGWGTAHEAAGADPATAARGADATYGFYTGQAPSE